jgi:hypothetical protein
MTSVYSSKSVQRTRMRLADKRISIVDDARAIGSGFNLQMSKPVDVDSLLDAILCLLAPTRSCVRVFESHV